MEKISTPPSVQIADKVRELERSGIKVAKLQTGEPSSRTPQYIIDAAYQAMLAGLTHYTVSQGIPELRQAIAEWYNEDFEVEVNKGDVFIGNGAVHVLFCVLSSILEPGSEVIIPEPYWPQYRNMTYLASGVPVVVNVLETEGKLSGERFENAINSNTKALIINNPCNPTGAVYSKDEVDELLRIAEKHEIFVVFDEVYNRITYTDNFCSVFQSSRYNRAKSQVAYVNSFSKTFSMTGWRVGYAILPNGLLQKSLKVSQNTITNVNTFSQYGALEAIKVKSLRLKELDQMKKLYRTRREILVKILDKGSWAYFCPEGAFYFFIQCDRSSKDFAMDLLESEYIAVVPGAAYGESCDSFFRVSFAVDEASFQKFLDWLSNSSSNQDKRA